MAVRNMAAKIVEVSLPEYNIKKKPDYLKLGKKVDSVIEKSFPDGKYILRAIGSSDHQGISLHGLVNIILKKGTDKYDPKRKDVCYEEFCEFDYDIQASTFEIKNGKLIVTGNKYPSIFGEVVYNFFEHAPTDRGYAVKIDLLLIYDPKKLAKAKLTNPNIKRKRGRWDKYLYKFKDQKNKKDALLGIVKITG